MCCKVIENSLCRWKAISILWQAITNTFRVVGVYRMYPNISSSLCYLKINVTVMYFSYWAKTMCNYSQIKKYNSRKGGYTVSECFLEKAIGYVE